MERKGEWLECRLAKSDYATPAAIESYLRERLGLPEAYINKMKKQNEIQQIGDRLRLRFFAEREFGFAPEWMQIELLFEDDFCLVANKPAGVSVHPAHRGHGGSLANAIAAYYEATGQQVAVRHIHRLDEWTSGPVLYAKNEYAQLMLDNDMRIKAIDRTYLAVVEGIPRTPKGSIQASIGKDRHVNGKRRVSSTGDHAVTHYEVVESFRHAALLRLTLETGRTHQIRVHLAHIGHPIYGDRLYGGRTDAIQRQALHGEALRFHHPIGGRAIEVHSETPEDIRAIIDSLRS